MRLLSAFVSIAVSVSTVAAFAASGPPQPERVAIQRTGGVLHGLLYKPEGDGPFATIIALHGCSGLGHGGQIQPRYLDWAERFLKAGDAVLFPDSYGSRGVGQQCQPKQRKIFARRERVADIRDAQQWLMQQPWVLQGRIGLLGWDNGASAVLWAVRPQIAWAGRHDDFRSAVVFYPDCRISSRLGWSTRVPTLLLIGAADDLSSPSACRQMVDDARGRSALARIVVYPNARHGFDRVNAPVHAGTGGGGHIGADSKARADSQSRVASWLAR
ncbi:dienelactone hydrolase family protein [Nitrobacter sp.]|uniref:dienelactone hydrolase family protein n=1 Tax=Nitrobacter sp. TaxID=29420 RepID=UPI003F64CF82